MKREKDPQNYQLRKALVKAFMEEYEQTKKVWSEKICAELEIDETDICFVVS